MSFCRQCGQPLARRWLSADSREREVCDSCHVVHYDNPKVLVACIVHWSDKLLLCQRAMEPARGRWYLPIGFMECGETLEEASSRELFEETGLQISPKNLALYGVVSLPTMNQVYLSFRSELSMEPDLCPGPETLAARFFAAGELPMQDLAFSEVATAFFPDFFKRLLRRDFTVRCVSLPLAGPAIADSP